MDRLARDRVRVACEILSAGRVVVTDRLHGHILCVLLGIPHVVLDNQHGKLSAYHSRWTRDSGVATFADSPEHAGELARQQLTRSYGDGT
jgi:pyruvyl transferase EpsO